MREILLLLLSLFIGTSLFLWIGSIVGWQEIKETFLVFTGWQGLVILGLTILISLLGNWKWREILKGMGAKVPFRELGRAYLASFSIRYLAPIIIVGGEILQGYILKKRNSIPWSKGMASVIIDRVLEWTVNLIVIFLGILFFFYKIGFPPRNLVIIFGGFFLFFFFAISFFYFKTLKRESIAKAIGKIFNHRLDNQPLEIEKEIFNFFRPKEKTLWKVSGLAFLRAGIMLLRAWLLIIFLGKSIGTLPAFSILGFNYLAVMIPIPTALGSHEVIQTFSFKSLGLGAATATVFTMIIRGAELLVALAGIIILFRFGLSLLKETIFKKLNNFQKK